MTPRLADLICLQDGSWELCRAYAWEREGGIDEDHALLRLPLELCADGTWTLSGLKDRKLRAVFGCSEKPIPDIMPSYINAQLHRLSEKQVLNENSWPDDAYPMRISGRGCRALDEMKSSITDFVHALSESDMSLIERIDESSPLSLAGLLRDAGESDLAQRFLQNCPENLLPLAMIPLASLDHVSQDGDCRFCFLRAIGYIDWTGETLLGRATEQLQVDVARNGVARARVTEWMFFGYRFRSIDACSRHLPLGDLRVLAELRNTSELLPSLIRNLANTSRKNLSKLGQARKPRELLVMQVSRIVRKGLDTHLQEIAQLAGKRIYPFDGLPRPIAYATYFAAPTDRRTRDRRYQARLATPLLAECVSTGRLPGAARAIDKAEPVIDTLADELRVPKWVISRLARLEELAPNSPDAVAPRRCPEDLAKVAEVMAALGPDATAIKPGSHSHDFVIWDHAARIGEILGQSHSIFGRDYFGHAKADTGLTIRAIGREPIPHSNDDRIASVEWIGGVASRIANEAASISLYYCIARESIRNYLQYDLDDRADVGETLAAWLLRQSATELLGAASRVADVMLLHCREFMSHTLLTALSESTCSLLETHVCDESGVEVIPLSSKEALEIEGRQMHHCVGGYWGRAANHQAELFSLNPGDTSTRATLCLSRDLVGRWEVEEFKHAHNREVTEARLLQAANALCRRLDDASREQIACAVQNISFARYDRSQLALQMLPAIAREQVLACLPGNEWLEARIERAIARAGRIRHRERRRI